MWTSKAGGSGYRSWWTAMKSVLPNPCSSSKWWFVVGDTRAEPHASLCAFRAILGVERDFGIKDPLTAQRKRWSQLCATGSPPWRRLVWQNEKTASWESARPGEDRLVIQPNSNVLRPSWDEITWMQLCVQAGYEEESVEWCRLLLDVNSQLGGSAAPD